jgi:hypothetical protein
MEFHTDPGQAVGIVGTFVGMFGSGSERYQQNPGTRVWLGFAGFGAAGNRTRSINMGEVGQGMKKAGTYKTRGNKGNKGTPIYIDR